MVNKCSFLWKGVFILDATEEMIVDKPFKDYDDLIEILKSRNVIINNEEFAKQCLSDISYYSIINGCKKFYTLDNDIFVHPVNFEELYLLYMIENTLNGILLKNILHIEKSLKSKLSYIISKNYGVITDLEDTTNMNPNDYLCRYNYQNNRNRNNTLLDIKRSISNTRNASINYYKTHHNHLPCWILINGIYFGQAIQLYQILNSDEKNYICNELVDCNQMSLDEKKAFLTNSLDVLREYRNNLAHGHTIFSNTIKSYISFTSAKKISNNNITRLQYNNGLCKNDTFCVVMIICTLTRGLQKENFIQELISFCSNMNKYTFDSKSFYDVFSFPHNIIDILKNKSITFI